MWIFSKKEDFFVIYLPMIILPIYFILTPNISELSLIIFFILIQLFDVGHVYSTIWMTLFDKKEIISNKFAYLVFPLMISLVFSFWLFFKLPYFWSFIAYFTLYHNFKQGYGIQRWYQKKNNRFCSISNKLFYFLNIIPIIILHFRNNVTASFYTKSEDMIFQYKGNPISFMDIDFDNFFYLFFIIIYLFSILFFLLNEINLYIKYKKFEISRLLFTLLFSFMYGISFIYFTDFIKMASTIILTHAFLYIYILFKKLPVLYPVKFKNKSIKLISFLLITIIVGSGFNYIIESSFIDVSYHYLLKRISLLEILFTLFYVIPTICHFYWDSIIWKNKHRFSKKIYS